MVGALVFALVVEGLGDGGRKPLPGPHETDVRAELVDLMAKVAAGEVRVQVERVYPFEEAAAALAKVTTRHARGKVVLTLGTDALTTSP